MIPPKSALLSTHASAGELVGRDRLARALDRGACAFRVDARLIARRLQFLDARPERRIVQIGDAAFGDDLEPLLSRLCGRGAVDQFRGMLVSAIGVSFGPWLKSAISTKTDALDGHPGYTAANRRNSTTSADTNKGNPFFGS